MKPQDDDESFSKVTNTTLSKVENSIDHHNTDMVPPQRSNTSFHSVRYIIISLCGLAIGMMFFARLSVTVAMVSMVNHTHLYLAEHANSTVEDFFESDYVEVGSFNWSNEIQQTIIAGYMLAYSLPQVLTTQISMKYGLRLSVTICLLICAISCLLTPFCAYWGWQWVLALRLLNGLGASSMIPIVIGAIENWLPDKDSALGLSLVQFVYTSIYIAIPLISGELASIHWELAFYVPGFINIVFALVWWLIARDIPDSCSFISQKEIDIIKGIEKNSITDSKVDSSKKQMEKKPRRTDLPWYFMFQFRSFYFFILVWMCYCCTFGGLLFLLPAYFHKILKISVKENGFYNFIIQLGVMFSMIWANPIISYLQNHCKQSLTSSRRIIVLIYTSMTVATLCYLAAYHENQILVICINRFFHMTNDTIVVATLMSQFGREGLSGMAYSVMNTFGNFTSIIFCWAAGRFLDYTGESRECWSWIFVSMALINVLVYIVYFLFLDSEPVKIPSKAGIKDNNEVPA